MQLEPLRESLRKKPMTWPDMLFGGCLYGVIAVWLFVSSRWLMFASILAGSAAIALFGAWDLWRKGRE
jgi:hypothetical protein